MPGKRGRPRRLTPALQKAICLNLTLAMPLKLAAEAEGVAESTLYEWLERGNAGKEGDEVFVAFSGAVTRAKAEGAKSLTARGLAGGKGSHAALWFLERRYREDYGPVQKIVFDGEHDLTDDERRAQIEAFKRTALGLGVPGGPDGLGDPSPRADAADAGEAPPASS